VDLLSLLVDDDMKVGTHDVVDDIPYGLEHTAEYKLDDKTGTDNYKRHRMVLQHNQSR
jgi:hypothetical protein